jgi:hypothetical protein
MTFMDRSCEYPSGTCRSHDTRNTKAWFFGTTSMTFALRSEAGCAVAYPYLPGRGARDDGARPVRKELSDREVPRRRRKRRQGGRYREGGRRSGGIDWSRTHAKNRLEADAVQIAISPAVAPVARAAAHVRRSSLR